MDSIDSVFDDWLLKVFAAVAVFTHKGIKKVIETHRRSFRDPLICLESMTGASCLLPGPCDGGLKFFLQMEWKN